MCSRMCEIVLLFIVIWSGICAGKVLIISMDGFRWDYISQTSTPNFDAFEARGTRAPFIQSAFITKTFPCHYSIATGLYEESHGIIANKMFDPEFNETFTMATKDSKWWDGGEPIWVTVRRAGLRSAIYFWPGSEAEIRGYRPNIYLPYEEEKQFKERVDTVVDWLSSADKNIDFAMLYFHEPDSTGHRYGPKSQEVRDKVKEMDGVLGYLVQRFDELSMWDYVNVLITSDHGMAEIDVRSKNIDLLDYVNEGALLQTPSLGPVANFMVAPGMVDEVISNLSNVDHLQVYKREDVPDHWHYSNNRRILDVVAVADEGWTIVKNLSTATTDEKGAHGFDNRLSSMKPIFYARGPNIKSGYKSSPFNSVDIYPLVCELLGVKPAPNNGSLDNTKPFITYSTGSAPVTATSWSIHIVVACLGIQLVRL